MLSMPGLKRTSLIVLLLAAILVGGCKSSKLPKTFPASGTVAWKSGQPLKGGSIQFRSEANPDLRVVGKIQDDGSFTLETILERQKVTGAPDGEYEVSVIPPLEGEHKGVPPISVPGRFKVVPGGENSFTIQIESQKSP
jgi:hypothetical protein